MDTEIFICVENTSRKLVAIELEPVGYTRQDDPYLRRNIKAYLNETFPPVGAIVTEAKLAEWKALEVNANERDTLYKLDGPKLSTSHDIFGFNA